MLRLPRPGVRLLDLLKFRPTQRATTASINTFKSPAPSEIVTITTLVQDVGLRVPTDRSDAVQAWPYTAGRPTLNIQRCDRCWCTGRAGTTAAGSHLPHTCNNERAEELARCTGERGKCNRQFARNRQKRRQ